MSTLFDTKPMKINRITPDKHTFTQIISGIAKPPKSLYFIGNLPETRLPSVAIVGTRKPTHYGREVTERIAGELAAQGIVIMSGLALGVDGIAHQAALDAGGTTIAVLANGLPDISPSSHRALAETIVTHGGAICSEYEPGTSARSYQFLERNRIVSGLSDAVLITEAAARSGTLNTAMHALEQGKELFVVPGNITSPMSAGCNHLLKQGAHVATCAEDIIETIAPELLRPQTALALGANPQEAAVLKLLQQGVRDGDELQRSSRLDAHTFASTLTMLEINGTIRALGANQWTLR